MKLEYDGKQLTVGAGPGMREAAIELMDVCIRETQKTRRLLMLTAMGLAAVAAVLLVFAPEGREVPANWMGGALMVIALGAARCSRFCLKLPPIELSVGEEEGAKKNDG